MLRFLFIHSKCIGINNHDLYFVGRQKRTSNSNNVKIERRRQDSIFNIRGFEFQIQLQQRQKSIIINEGI
jgi:hypothetical protein